MSSHYEKLSHRLALMEARACEINRKFLALSVNPQVCIEQAIMNYRVSNATVALMKEVIRCSARYDENEVLQPLVRYMKKHIPEEAGHDEWFLDDLTVLGVSREEVKAKLPNSNISSLIGSQYYWINHVHPVAFMGYLFCSETHHPTVEYVEKLIANSGLPAEGFSSLMHHAKLDVHHKEDIINVLNGLPLTEDLLKIVEMSAFQTYRYIALVMEDVCKTAPIVQKAIA
ncbi:hypothetical protein tinsulaeT_33840 [Thalassotalea insulae]|uniref:Iron-containing redox enzyme family protein n=1 Tax=Thalassotalea insulae TaxID=2056778 RepID=A0ABQ6GXK1_9GAMM|nr:iron-containing redox enzyme family protein [Thalassotalea insulae]GLX80044.1 hypothetical protein tinsulaeT_33840 [Thalassotalea insulae]